MIDRVDHRIVNQPGRVILLFLAITVVFASGLGAIETETGQQQFIEDLPSFQAFEDIQRDFGASFGRPSTSTTLVQDSSNVLAKPALLRMLRSQRRIVDSDPLRVTNTVSAARTVASTIDPTATTLDAQVAAVERATPAEIDAAVRRAAATEPGFETRLSNDFSAEAAAASAAEATVTHRAGRGVSTGGGPGAGASFPPNRDERVRRIISDTAPDI